MKPSSRILTSELIESAVISNREALRRMIQYAWAEAEREGAGECAELLSAALLALDHATQAAGDGTGRSLAN